MSANEFNPAALLAGVRQNIASACARCGRDVSEVALIGASKTVSAERLAAFIAAGLRDVGENYIQEGTVKIAAMPGRPDATWHFIGALQSNKARVAVACFDLIHSVDRVSLARELDKAARGERKVQRILLQVNVSGESSKAGCAPHELAALLDACRALENLRVEGLMALPAYEAQAEAVRPAFAQLRALRDEAIPGGVLSMGMSNDYTVAIEEGATHIRLGTALFGARK